MAASTMAKGKGFEEGPLTEPQDTPPGQTGSSRIAAIDMMRGLVIAIMVLDHVRDYFHINAFAFDPTDPTQTNLLLYLTRWITHLCAPTFVLLAGVSIWIQMDRGKTGNTLSGFLLSRGFWLIFLEMTVISFAWNLGPTYFANMQVIWAIGASMVLMALIARLPAKAVLAIGVAICMLFPLAIFAILGGPPVRGNPPPLWVQMALTGGFWRELPGLILYPVLPWTGVMCVGFGLGPVFAMEPAARRKAILRIGLGLLAAFLLVRGIDGYGNFNPWEVQDTALKTGMDFFDVLKYPPTPAFLLATLGFSMLLFLAVEKLRGWFADVLLAYGRTPLFTYIVHLYIIHLMMLAASALTGRSDAAIDWMADAFGPNMPAPWGYGQWAIYPIWLLVLLLLIPLSRWMAGLKRRRRDWWLSYI